MHRLIAFLLVTIVPPSSTLTRFDHSFVITSADINAGQILNLTTVPGDYIAYLVTSQATENFNYLMNVFILGEDETYSANNLFDINNKPIGFQGELHEYEIIIKKGAVKGLRIHDRNDGSTKPDPFVLYVVEDLANMCNVYSARVLAGCSPFKPTQWGGCPGAAMILSAEPAMALYNFGIESSHLDVYTAPTDAISNETMVFSTKSRGIAASTTVYIAGPVAFVTMESGFSFKFSVSITPSYNATFAPGTGLGVSSVGYCSPTRNYNHPYPPTIIPPVQHFTMKALGSMETTLRGISDASNIALQLAFIDGTTKQYSHSFNDHFTAGGRGVDIKADAKTTYFVQIIAL